MFSWGKLGELSILQAGNISETKLRQEPHCTGQYLRPVHFKDNLFQPDVNSGEKKKIKLKKKKRAQIWNMHVRMISF